MTLFRQATIKEQPLRQLQQQRGTISPPPPPGLPPPAVAAAAAGKPHPPPGMPLTAGRALGSPRGTAVSGLLSSPALGTRLAAHKRSVSTTALRSDKSSIPTSLATLRVAELEGTIAELKLGLGSALEAEARASREAARLSVGLKDALEEQGADEGTLTKIRVQLGAVQADFAAAHEKLARQAS